MNRKLCFAMLILMAIGIHQAFARPMHETQTAPVRAREAEEQNALDAIRNNQYFLESQRLLKLAQETYSYGDYDTSNTFAEESFHYALLSDVHVAIATAQFRIDETESSGASTQYPAEFSEARMWYKTSLNARDSEEWEEAIDAAHKVVELLAQIKPTDGTTPLPASYTVRAWITFGDCFWNIAARPWAYGDPWKWRTLYNANRSKLPNPDNPNLIEPGMVLDIPSIKGETRQGAWDSERSYSPLN